MNEDILKRPLLDAEDNPEFDLSVTENPLSDTITEVEFKCSIGTANISVFTDKETGKQNVHYNSIEVNGDRRREGFGRLLTQAVINYCLDKGINKITGIAMPKHPDFIDVPITDEILQAASENYGFEYFHTGDGPHVRILDLKEKFGDKISEITK